MRKLFTVIILIITIFFINFGMAIAAENNTQKALAYIVAIIIVSALLFCAGWSIKKLMKHTRLTPGNCIWIGVCILTILTIGTCVFLK